MGRVRAWAAVAAGVLVALLVAGYLVGAAAAGRLEVRVVDLSLRGLVVELRNGSPLDLRVEELRLTLRFRGGGALEAWLDRPVTVPAGGAVTATLDVDVGLGGLVGLLFAEDYDVYAYAVVKPQAGPLPLPRVTLKTHSHGGTRAAGGGGAVAVTVTP